MTKLESLRRQIDVARKHQYKAEIAACEAEIRAKRYRLIVLDLVMEMDAASSEMLFREIKRKRKKV
jgi:hypothetical protein